MRRRLGLTYEDPKPLNPLVIYASITAYGEQGPEQERVGFDAIAYWSRTGLMDLVRSAGSKPTLSLPGMGDHPTSVALYASIVTALLQRERTGEGSMVHTSLIANGIWAASCIATARFAHGSDSTNYPTLMARYFTRELYETADGRWIQFNMVRTDEEFHSFMQTLGCEHLLRDPRFHRTRARIESGDALANEIRPIIGGKTAKEWIKLFADVGIPVSMVGSIDDLPQDPQLQPNRILINPPKDVGADFLINHPVNVEKMKRAEIRRAPDVGEHTDEVLSELGYNPSEIRELKNDGAV